MRTVSSPDPVAIWYLHISYVPTRQHPRSLKTDLLPLDSAGFWHPHLVAIRDRVQARPHWTKTHPFGAKSIERISLICPSSTIAVLPVLRSHTLPIPSNPPEAANAPSSWNASAYTSLLWPS